MAFRVLRILQVGDLHQPDWPLERVGRDVKTALQSKLFSDSLGHYAVERVLSALLGVQGSIKVDAVVFVGDFTTRGDVDGLAACVAHMAALFSPEIGATSRTPVVAVPGNHDVNQKDATRSGMTGKFATLDRLVRSRGWPAIPVNDEQFVDLPQSDGTADRIYMLNSCLGSWELAAFGRNTVKSLKELRKIAASGMPDVPLESFSGKNKADLENLQYDNYDAPFISQSALASLTQDVAKRSPESPVIVVGHHNLLQQQIPRYAPFAELLNAGSLRRSLQRTSRPTLYLHGHIHEGPIETITDAENPKGVIVSISAPALPDGFNLIELHLADDSPPLGVTIRRYRLKPNGDVQEEDPVRVALAPTNHKRKIIQREASILSLIDKEGVISFARLRDHRIVMDAGLSESDLEHLIVSLYWRSLLDIENLSTEPVTWRIKAPSA